MSGDEVQHRDGRPKPGDADYVDERASTGKRGYRWPVFERNNLMSVKSGVGSDRIVTRLASQLVDWVTSEHSDLAESRYRFSVAAWARAESVVGLLTHYLDQIDVVDGDGEPREKLLSQLRTAERRASEERSALGLSPAAHAKLERQRAEAVKGAADLSGIKAAGRKALERHRERVDSVGRVSGEGERVSGSEGTS